MRTALLKLLIGLGIVAFKVVKGPGIAGFVRCMSSDCISHNIVSGIFLGLGIWLAASGVLDIERGRRAQQRS
jgi:hypothetical protein